MLEDDFTYVLRKALTGHQLTPAEAAAAAGLPEHAVHSFLHGEFKAQTARALAAVLDLNVEAFAAHATYDPAELDLPYVRRLDLPFSDGQVNAWLATTGDAPILFDAGYDARDFQEAISGVPERAFITHAHRDHIGGIAWLSALPVPIHAAGIPDTIPMAPGESMRCGPLVIRACDLSGHANPALGYLVEGYDSPLLVTGDALFAGSIGGCKSPALYQQALLHLRTTLAPLPDATILLPGHGPATTLGEERRGNPFL